MARVSRIAQMGGGKKKKNENPDESIAKRCKVSEEGYVLAGCNSYYCPFYKPEALKDYVRTEDGDEISLYSPEEIEEIRERADKLSSRNYKVKGYWKIESRFRRVYE